MPENENSAEERVLTLAEFTGDPTEVIALLVALHENDPIISTAMDGELPSEMLQKLLHLWLRQRALSGDKLVKLAVPRTIFEDFVNYRASKVFESDENLDAIWMESAPKKEEKP